MLTGPVADLAEPMVLIGNMFRRGEGVLGKSEVG